MDAKADFCGITAKIVNSRTTDVSNKKARRIKTSCELGVHSRVLLPIINDRVLSSGTARNVTAAYRSKFATERNLQ